MRGRRLAGLLSLAGFCLSAGAARAADEFSGADKLRALYSAEFRFTDAGLPVVPVAIAQGVSEVSVSAEGGLRLLPEGDGGPEVVADDAWRVRAEKTTAARVRYWPIVWRGKGQQGAEAAAQARQWQRRGLSAKSFEQGTLFAVAGEVLDRREVLVGTEPATSWEAAEKTLERLRVAHKLTTPGIYTELLERPHGLLQAVGERSGARVRNEGVLWFSAATAGKPVRITWRRSGAQTGKEAGKEPTGGGSYHGRIYVTLDRTGRLAVVNAVPESQLLAGLVPAEIFPSAPEEALKAQAVAARGELLAKIGTRHTGEPFRLCAQTHCQVYAGATRETPRTTAAVEATRGEVLFETSGKGGGAELVDTRYSASCGGHTEHNENVWPDMGPHPALRGHRDILDKTGSDPFARGVSEALVQRFIDQPPPAFCGSARGGGGPDRFRWTVTRSAAELERLLASHKVGRIKAIEILERGVSGRARRIKIVGATGTQLVTGELRIRQTFGGLRSSLFVVTLEGGAATFRGAGFGHGVGLCQTGAIGMAEAGKSYREILRHYYQGSVVRKLW